MSGTTSRIFGLDLIRTIAISLVVFSHCTYLIIDDSTNLVITATRAMGAIGVDMFFVLSGYLIGGILLRNINSTTSFKDLLTFWKRRWFRTLPNYYLVLFLNCLLFLILGKNLFSESWLYIPFLQNFSSSHPDFFTEAWSLSIEEYAYILLPFLLYIGLLFFKPQNRNRFFAIVSILAIVLLYVLKLEYSVRMEIHSYKQWSATFRKVVIYRIDMIYFGFLLIYSIRRYFNIIERYKVLLFVSGMLLFVGMHLAISYFNMSPQTYSVFYIFFYLQLIAFSLGMMFPFAISLKANKLINKFIYYVSTRSYAIYLINFSLILMTLRHYFDISNITPRESLILVSFYLILTIIASEILYVYFEKPILRFRDKKYKR